MFTRFIFLAAFIAALWLAPVSAGAADDVNDAPNLTRNYRYQILFVRKPGSLPNEATLRLTKPVSVSGCVTIEPPEVTTKASPPRMQIDITKPVVKLDKSKRYAHYECSNAGNAVQVDIPLNHDDLMIGGIKTISIKTPSGRQSFDVIADEYHIELLPKGGSMFEPYNSGYRQDPLIHWFYPDNVVVLSAPQAKKDVTDQIKAAAHARGLVDASSLTLDFKSPTTAPNTLYFVDQGQVISKGLNAGDSKVFGSVEVGETFMGPDGPYERAKQLEIIARLPGLYE